MRSQPILAVDCGASHVAVARLVRDGREGRPAQDFVSEPLEAPGRDDEAWVASVGRALQAVAGRGDLRGPCILGLPGHLTLTRSLEIPPMSAGHRRRVIRFEAHQGLPCPASELIWSHAIVNAGGDRQHVVITSVRRGALSALCQKIREAGLFPVAAFPAWLGALAGGEEIRGDGTELVVSVGAWSTQVVLRERAGGRLCRNLGYGGEALTQGVAEELGVDVSRAETLKREHCSGSSRLAPDAPERVAVQLALDRFTQRLGGEILRTLAAACGPERRRWPEQLRMRGGGALAPGLAANLARAVSVRAEPKDGPPRQANDMSQSGLESSHLDDLAGLVRCVQRRDRAGANLLPKTLRRSVWLARRWPWIVAAAVLAVVGLAGGGHHWKLAGRSLRRAAAALDAETGEVRRRVTERKQDLARLAALERNIAAYERLSKIRVAWTLLLADLEQRVRNTGDVWLERLELLPASQSPSSPARPRSQRKPPPAPTTAIGRADVRLRLGGCVLDPDHPFAPAGEKCRERVKSLWADLAGSPRIASLTDERFDASQPGVLRFEVTVVLAPGALP